MRSKSVLAIGLAVSIIAAQPAHAARAVRLTHVTGDDEVRATLLRQTQELVDAVTIGKASVWELYLDDKAIIASEDGSVTTKADVVAHTKPLPPGVSGTIKVTDFKVEVHDNVSVTNHVDDETENFFGHLLHCQYRVTDTWLKTGAGWRLIGSQVIALRADPPAVSLSTALMKEYCGRYKLTPDISFDIRCKGDSLEGQQSGHPARVLKAEAPDVLFIPGQPRYRRVILRDTSGKVTGFAERREEWDLNWTREP